MICTQVVKLTNQNQRSKTRSGGLWPGDSVFDVGSWIFHFTLGNHQVLAPPQASTLRCGGILQDCGLIPYSRVDELSEVSKEPDEVLEILISTPSSTIRILPSEVIDFVGSWMVCEAVVFEDVLLEEGIGLSPIFNG